MKISLSIISLLVFSSASAAAGGGAATTSIPVPATNSLPPTANTMAAADAGDEKAKGNHDKDPTAAPSIIPTTTKGSSSTVKPTSAAYVFLSTTQSVIIAPKSSGTHLFLTLSNHKVEHCRCFNRICRSDYSFYQYCYCEARS
jgi:hypothetical protein